MVARTTRLAPSPTGAFHLGNARTFLATWLLARQRGWDIILRNEDLDGPRIHRGAAAEAIEDLNWLGLNWDRGPIDQSTRLPCYREAIESLVREGKAYPCICSRREAQLAASAPHAEDGLSIYPGVCRDRFESMDEARKQSGREPAIRFRVPDEIVSFEDQFAGAQSFDSARALGDFVIGKFDGTPAYQLAVVIDDAEMEVTDVIRGDDLLNSTPRQMLIYRALNMDSKIPNYIHLPLVVGTDGKRLAKRHGDTRLSSYRAAGVSSSRMLSLLARWLGMDVAEGDGESLTSVDLIERFRLESVSQAPIVFDATAHAWLMKGGR